LGKKETFPEKPQQDEKKGRNNIAVRYGKKKWGGRISEFESNKK